MMKLYLPGDSASWSWNFCFQEPFRTSPASPLTIVSAVMSQETMPVRHLFNHFLLLLFSDPSIPDHSSQEVVQVPRRWCPNLNPTQCKPLLQSLAHSMLRVSQRTVEWSRWGPDSITPVIPSARVYLAGLQVHELLCDDITLLTQLDLLTT